MNEVEIPLKISGIAEIKAELKALKGELTNATDPEEMARLAEEAGKLSDQLNDANEKAALFANGSKYQQSRNAFASMKGDLMELDFEGAQEKAKIFATTLGKINPAQLGGSMKALMGTIGTLGQAFVKLGATILMNPIFLIVAAITAIIVVIGLVLKKFGVLDDVLQALMAPINALIEGFEDLTDWLGFTNNAGEEAAEAEQERHDNRVKQMKREQEVRERAYSREQAGYDNKIKLAKAEGKSTYELEKAKINASIRYQSVLKKELESELSGLYILIEKKKAVGEDVSGDVKQIADLKKRISDASIAIENSRTDLKVLDIEKKKAEAEALKSKEKNNTNKKEGQKNNEERIKIERELRDYELSQIKDTAEREIAITTEKYARLQEDLKKDKKKTAEQKLEYEKIYNDQLAEELKTQEANRRKIAEDNERKANEAILQLRLQLMPEGTEKEKALQDDKYKKLRDAAIADTTLTEEKRNEILALYDEQRRQEDQKKIDEKSKQQAALLLLLQSQEDQELEALRVKYEEERKLAEGNAALLLALEDKYTKDKQKIQDDANLREIEAARVKRDAIIQASQDIFSGLSNLGTSLIKDQKKLEKFNKASALIQIGIDTAKAISALVAQSQANPFNAITAGAAGVAQFATGIIQILTNIAKAKQILSSGGTPSASGGGGGGGNGGGGGGGATAQVVPQAAQLFGQANTGNQVQAGGQTTESSMTVTAVVSETAMTSTQNKIQRINKNAEL